MIPTGFEVLWTDPDTHEPQVDRLRTMAEAQRRCDFVNDFLRAGTLIRPVYA